MTRILITNDDGIGADGLARLVRAAADLGEVWVVAPDGQRSAASRGITIRDAVELRPQAFPVEGVRAFSCSGMPADCVRVGCLYALPAMPDWVLSGVNHGYNLAVDIAYSGTVGAALEGSALGASAIALSEGQRPCHEVTDALLRETLVRLMDRPLPRGQIWNVNFPDCPMASFRGVLEDRHKAREVPYREGYVLRETLEGFGVRVSTQRSISGEAEKGSDLRAVMDGYASIGTITDLN